MYDDDDDNDPLDDANAIQRWLDQQLDSALNRDGPLDGIHPVWDGAYQFRGGVPLVEVAPESHLGVAMDGKEMFEGDEMKNEPTSSGAPASREEKKMNKKIAALNARLAKCGFTWQEGHLHVRDAIELYVPPDIRQQVLAYADGQKGFTVAAVTKRLIQWGVNEYERRYGSCFQMDADEDAAKAAGVVHSERAPLT